MREYKLNLNEYSISKYRYVELKAFCLQYQEKKSKINELYTLSSVSFDSLPASSVVSDTTQKKALKIIKLKNDIAIVDKCIKAVSENNGDIEKQLRANVTQNIGYDRLGWMPCGRKQFFMMRRKFFYYLDLELT